MNNPNVHRRRTEVKFQITIRIDRSKDNSKAYYKQDGERFDKPQTLKLLSNVDYILTMEIPLSMELIYVMFGGIENSFQLINDPKNEEKSIYQFHWSTLGCKPNTSKHRSDVISKLKFKNFNEIEFRLQVKFYREENVEHAKWGTPLNSIILECTAGRGTYDSSVDAITYI